MVIADFRRRQLLAPEQTAALQAQVEERMWVAADSAALRLLEDPNVAADDAGALGGEHLANGDIAAPQRGLPLKSDAGTGAVTMPAGKPTKMLPIQWLPSYVNMSDTEQLIRKAYAISLACEHCPRHRDRGQGLRPVL